METNISSRAEELGPVPPLHVDLLRFAVLVFLVDRSVLRKRGTGFRWERELDLTVPVSDPVAWTSASDELAHHLHVLTGDWWTLTFEKERPRKKRPVAEVEPSDVVCLFSGGADSLAGALAAHAEHRAPPVLVSHWDFSALSKVQTDLIKEMEGLWGARPEHHRIELTRWARQVGSGVDFPDEKSRRSRSMLFLALGLAVAAARGAELWMSENGFTSINPPLAPERRGSLTTRTANPRFLDGLADTLRTIGLTVHLRNPFESQAKGAVIADAAAALPHGVARKLFSLSHSCGKPSWLKGFKLSDQCGVCYGCLVRRGAFIAAGLTDETEYIETTLRGAAQRGDFLTPARRKTIEAVRYRLARGYDERDILSLALPPRLTVADALKLAREGLAELAPVVNGIP